MPKKEQMSYKKLVEAMLRRYKPAEKKQILGWELQNMKQKLYEEPTQPRHYCLAQMSKFEWRWRRRGEGKFVWRGAV